MAPTITLDDRGDIRIILPANSTNATSNNESANDPTASGPAATPGNDVAMASNLNPTEIIVSSTVLCLVSPVFKAMLTGPFHEARALATSQSTSQLYDLVLPEDNAPTMTILLQVLHHRYDGLPTGLSPADLEKLAFAIDKYDCAQPFRHIGAIWVARWLHAKCKRLECRREYIDEQEDLVWVNGNGPWLNVDWEEVFTGLCRAVVFTYVVGLAKEFSDACWHLVWNHAGSLRNLMTRVPEEDVKMLWEHPLVGKEVGRYIDDARRVMIGQFHDYIMAPFEMNTYNSLNTGCSRASLAIGDYLAWLQKHKLLFRFRVGEQTSLRDLVVLVLNEEGGKIELTNYPCSWQADGWICPCQSDLEGDGADPDISHTLCNHMEHLRSWSHWHQHFPGGICLDCIKTDGKSKKEGKCAIQHDWDWEHREDDIRDRLMYGEAC
ncbi:hypothetical protein OQA88_2684 [Cercophora sp. LCS_1]